MYMNTANLLPSAGLMFRNAKSLMGELEECGPKADGRTVGTHLRVGKSVFQYLFHSHFAVPDNLCILKRIRVG